MKKIILMYDFFSEHGGVERIMLFQAQTLRKAGYDVKFAFAYLDEKLKEERLADFEAIEYAKLIVKNETLQICSSILRNEAIKKFKDADLIICHSFPASYFALRIKKKFKIPYILHLHHPPQFLYTADLDWAKNSFKRKFSFLIGSLLGGFLKKFDFYCVKNADDYILECKTVERIIKKTYNINGFVSFPTVGKKFEIKKCSLKELSKYGIKKNYVLGSGRIVNQKRFDYLISAFSLIKDLNLQLVLVGKYDENTKKELEEIARNKNLDILFLGPLELNELIKVYNLAKVTVLTCPKEWFGLVPIEAMACGCPVVAWKDNFGPQETVIDEKNGFLAKPYDTKDLADKIKMAVDKKWNKKEIRKTTFKFSEEKISKELISKINNFLKSASGK